MNMRLLRVLPVAMAIMAVGCTEDHRQTSTEVENEVSARVVFGTAMDSEAIAFAEVTVWDGSGAKLASGTTDSIGRFSLALSADPVGGILVMVRDSLDTLRALAPLGDLTVHQGMVTLNINGLSEAAVPPGFGKDPSQGFSSQTAWNALHRGQDLMDSVVGMKFDWNDVAFDPDFRPVSFKSDRTPSPYAGFLRAMEVRASREGKGGDQWVRSLETMPGRKVASDSLFAVDLARSISSLRLSQDQTEGVLKSLDSAAGHPGVWVDVWRDRQILSDPSTLQTRVPWASRVEYRELWRHLVDASGDVAVSFEASLAPSVRDKVRPGRSHEILATAVGGFIYPDSFSNTKLDALDSLLARFLPQARLALEQIRPDAWIPSPPLPRDAQDKPFRDGVADLIGFSMATQLSMPWNYSAYQSQIDPGAWLRTNHKLWTNSQAALDTMRVVLSYHPEFRFPAAPLP
jgi:hypothetical protein